VTVTLRVAINAFFQRHLSTGTGQYMSHLLSTLCAQGGAHEYLVIGGLGDGGSSNLSKIWLEQVEAPRRAASLGADVLHYPYFAAPLFSPVPVVVTIHDLIPILLPAYHGSALVRLYTALAAAGARRARLVLADSESTRTDVVARLGVAPGRVRVVLLAPSPRFRQPISEAEQASVRERYALPPHFVLYVGGLDQRKNVPRLVEAFAQARRQWHLPHYLVILGARRPHSAFFPDPARAAARAGVDKEVLFPGHVPEHDLPAFYSLADAFAYPSRYEGFGLPPLEAMACGTPVVCSGVSSLPEVVGDAGLLVPPDDTKAWAEALATILTDQSLREELKLRGRERARRFSWERTAEETLRAYQEAAG